MNESSEFDWEKYHQERDERRKKYRRSVLKHRGFTRDDQEAFWKMEEERLKSGESLITQLDLSNRAYNNLRRFGAQTVPGVEQIMRIGWKPNNLGWVYLGEIQASLEVYRQEHPLKDAG